MEKINKLIKGVNSPYRDFWVRLIVSFLAAHFILSHTTEYGFFEVIMVNGYTLSLIGSFIIASIIVYAVFKVTVILDKKVPYATNWKKRFTYQLLLGVLAISALAAGLALVLFWLINEPQRIWRYFNQDFAIILAFIIGINAYYYIRYLVKVIRKLIFKLYVLLRRSRRQTIKSQVIETAEPLPAAVKQIAVIYIESHRRYRKLHTDGTTAMWPTTLEETIKELEENKYFMINRQCIVDIDMIRCIKKYPSRRYLIILKSPLHGRLSEKILVVSQPNVAQFVRWVGDRNIWV